MAETRSRLHFDETRPPSKLMHVISETPLDVLAVQLHREATESDNSAAEAADAGITAAEMTFRAARHASYHRKLKARRNFPAQTEQPKSAKLQQKTTIKKDYADAKRTSGNTANASEIASRAAKSVGEKVRRTVEYVQKNSHVILIVLALGALLLMFMSVISSCSMLFSGALGSIGSTSYPSAAESILQTEALYCRMEDDLRAQLDHVSQYMPGYDEYHVIGAVSGHDPHVLAAILSSLHGDYAPDEVSSDLSVLFSEQYTLKSAVRRVTRYRTETRTEYREFQNPANGSIYLVPYTYQVRVPYSHSICTVTLTCTPMEDVAEDLLTEAQMKLYETYLETKGNYHDLFFK